MNLIDAYVTKVRKITKEYDKYFVHVWYKDVFSEGEHTTSLMFNTMAEAEEIQAGHKFLI